MTSTAPQTMVASTRRRPWRLLVIVTYTLRSCIGPKRWLGCLLPCAGALLFGLLAHTMPEGAGEAFARVAADGIFALVVPIAVARDRRRGARRRGALRRVPLHVADTDSAHTDRSRSVDRRDARGSFVTIVPACALAALVAGDGAAVQAAVIASAFGAAAYIAVFIAIGCVARRAAVWSLAFVFLVERLLGTALSGIAQWSPTWESRAVFVDFAPGAPNSIVRDGIPGRRRRRRAPRADHGHRARHRALAAVAPSHHRRCRLTHLVCPGKWIRRGGGTAR